MKALSFLGVNRPNQPFYKLFLRLALVGTWAVGLTGTALPVLGRPIIETFSAHEIGIDATYWSVAEDLDGQLLVGSEVDPVHWTADRLN